MILDRDLEVFIVEFIDPLSGNVLLEEVRVSNGFDWLEFDLL